MVVMFKMTPEKKEKFVKKLDKMSDFIEEFKECLESANEEENFRHDDYDEEDDYVKVPRSRYAKMMKRDRMGY